jgi:hypothetical protein
VSNTKQENGLFAVFARDTAISDITLCLSVYYKLSAAENQLRSGVPLLSGEDVFGKLREKQRIRRCTNP